MGRRSRRTEEDAEKKDCFSGDSKVPTMNVNAERALVSKHVSK